MPASTLLMERERTHGAFHVNAKIAQGIKDACSHGQEPTKAEHREALDLIATKIGRILSGQANFKDHWDDIAGYAKLASEACDSR